MRWLFCIHSSRSNCISNWLRRSGMQTRLAARCRVSQDTFYALLYSGTCLKIIHFNKCFKIFICQYFKTFLWKQNNRRLTRGMNDISRYFTIQLHAVQCGRGGWSWGSVGPYVSSSMGLSSVTLASRIPSLAINPWMVSILRLHRGHRYACLLAFFMLKSLLDYYDYYPPELRMFLVRQPRPVL